jgi:RNA polymerase sigma factor for flagellar operon FliA
MSSAAPTAPARTITRAEYDRLMPMVRHIAMGLARRLPTHITVADLVSAGWVGVMEASSRCRDDMPDEEFAAYASHRVRGAMLDYLRSLDPASRRARAASRKLAETIGQLRQSLGRQPTEEEVAGNLGITLDSYYQLLNGVAEAGMTRVDMVDFDRLDAIPDAGARPDEVAERHLLVEGMVTAINDLPERLQLVLALLYQEGCTLREVGAVLEVTESRACQLHAEAIHRLRASVGGS